MNPLRRWKRVDVARQRPATSHVRIVWASKTGESGSIRVIRFEAANYIQQLRSRFGRLASLKVSPD